MSRGQSQPAFQPGRTVKKFLLSAFVVFTFIAYVIHERLTNPDAALTAAQATPGVVATQPAASAGGVPAAAAPPSNSSGVNSSSQAGYKDGTYTGPQVDAFYGLVQVQARVQNGKISSVQFLEYPNDRRTSVQINDIAMPYLQQEAIQAQSPNVDIISGATLTSEGFIMSLQNALASAKN